MAQPAVFVNICNMNEVIRMATTAPSFKYYPAYFLYLLCYSHVSIFRMDPKHVFSEKALARAWSQMLCGTPAGCFAIAMQQKANLILQSYSIHCCSRLCFGTEGIIFACEKEGSQRPFFLHCFLLVNFTTVLPWLQLTLCSFREKGCLHLRVFSCFSGNYLNVWKRY